MQSNARSQTGRKRTEEVVWDIRFFHGLFIGEIVDVSEARCKSESVGNKEA